MTFEEEFPSFPCFGKYKDMPKDYENWDDFINWDEDMRGYDIELIKNAMLEFCLDKEKVRKALKNFEESYIYNLYPEITIQGLSFKKFMEKELGL